MTITESLERYKESIKALKKATAEAELALGRDGGSGVSAIKTSTMGFIDQPVVQFVAGSKFACRAANFDINAGTILHQAQNIYETTNTHTRVVDFDVTQASSLVSHQSSNYQRMVTGEDFGYSKDRRRYTSNSFDSANYMLIQVDSGKDKVTGVPGRFEVNASDSVNLNARSGYLVGRAAKKAFFSSKDFGAQASGTVEIQAGLAATVSATTSLSLVGRGRAALTSNGTTSVTSTGPVVISGSIVQINGGAAGLVKGVINMDAVKVLTGAVMPSTAANILVSAASGLGVSSFISPLLSGSGAAGLLTKAASDLASGSFNPASFVSSALTGILKSKLDSFSAEITSATGLPGRLASSFATAALSNGTESAVRQVISKEITDRASSLVSYGLADLAGRGQVSTLVGLAGEGILKGKGFESITKGLESLLGQKIPNVVPGIVGGMPTPPTVRKIPVYTPPTTLPKTEKLQSGLASSTPRVEVPQ